MKTVLFVPGFRDSAETHDYASVLRAIESRGYATEFVPIDWFRTDIDSWVDQLEATYSKHDPKQTVLAGFSFGAVTAFVTANRRTPDQLWLFSLSPCFAEDAGHKNKAWLRDVGRQRSERFERLEFSAVASNISCPAEVFYGEREGRRYPDLKKRAELTNAAIPLSNLHMVPECEHDVADPRYVRAIGESISEAPSR